MYSLYHVQLHNRDNMQPDCTVWCVSMTDNILQHTTLWHVSMQI